MTEPVKSFEQLLSLTKRLAISRKWARAALIGANEPSYLKMVVRAAAEGLIDPLLIGPRKEIEESARLHNLDIGKMPFVDLGSRTDMISEAIKLAVDDRIDFLVRGNMSTGLMLARMFERPCGLRVGKNLVSHVAVFEHELYPRWLFMTDGGVNIAPGVDQKLALIQNAVGVARLLGVDMPRVAMLAAVEVIYTAMPVTMEGAVIARMADKGQIKKAIQNYIHR